MIHNTVVYDVDGTDDDAAAITTMLRHQSCSVEFRGGHFAQLY